jgi:sulfatase modifying factor 1
MGCDVGPKNMVEVPAGMFRMGFDDFYLEERPVREVSVDGFRIDRPVTVAEFRRFVSATGYVTWAKAPQALGYPHADPASGGALRPPAPRVAGEA